MPTDAELSTVEEKRPEPSAQGPKKKKKKKKPAPIARPLDEKEINAPDLQTLLMLGALAAMSITLWAFAHAGCNYHPPRETRVPRKVSTADLTRDPKGAAVELQQRLATLNYDGALEIAAGPLAKELEAEKATCAKDPAACDARREKRKAVISFGEVLTNDRSSAKVRVISHRLADVPEGKQRYLALVERDPKGNWKVTGRVPDAPGAVLPQPTFPPAFRTMTFPPFAAPNGSGSPSTATPPHGVPQIRTVPQGNATQPASLPPGHP